MNVRFITPKHGVISTAEFDLPFEVRRSKRAKKRCSLRMTIGVLILTIPYRSDAGLALRILTKREAWIAAAFARSRPCGPLFLGKPLHVEQTSAVVSPKFAEGTLSLPPAGSPIAEQLEAWYRWQAGQYLQQKLPAFAARLQVSPVQVRIKDQRTRWGSCSSKGNLNFNWRLIMAPESIFDAVIMHELAHLRVPNHSAQFWELLHTVCPNYAEVKTWLKQNGPRLSAWTYTDKGGDPATQ